MGGETTAGLEITDLSKQLGGNTVVKGISLSARQGELVCLLGPSGCGKTTTLRMIGGFLKPDGGRIAIAGRDVTDLPPERRPTAMVFQNYALWPHMSVYKNIAYGLRLRKMHKRDIDERVDAVLKMVNLAHLRNRSPVALSGGEQQRVALARAVVLEPSLLLLDEPLSNLDAKLRVGVREEIREIQQRLQITTVFVTHDQDEALSIADRIAVMSSGNIEQCADPDELYRRPECRFVASFIGTMNLFDGRVASGGVVIDPGEVFVPCEDGVLSDLPDEEGTRWEIAVRPEDVLVSPVDATDVLPHLGRIVRQVPHGHFKEVLVGFDHEVSIRSFVGPEVDCSGPVVATIRRLLLYRDGALAYESRSPQADADRRRIPLPARSVAEMTG